MPTIQSGSCISANLAGIIVSQSACQRRLKQSFQIEDPLVFQAASPPDAHTTRTLTAILVEI